MAAGKRLTKTIVDRLELEDVVWDSDVRGFGVRRRRRDSFYVLKYRISGCQRYVTIGKHGAPWTPETARKEAQRLLGAIHAGNDPAVKRDQTRREARLSAVLDRYVSEHVAAQNKPSTQAEVIRQIERNIRPALGDIRISELTKADIKKWHSGFADRPYEGNRGLAYLRKALTLASRDWELRKDNPALGIQMFPESRRDRFFSPDELGRIGDALRSIEVDGATAGAIRAIRLLAFTGMRLGEVLGLRWDWIDFQAGCVRLPEDAAKAGARSVPLGAVVVSYLSTLERIGAFVCFGTANPSGPVREGSIRRVWELIRSRAELVNGRPHDLRHTMATYAAQTGANAFGIRDLLGHKTLAMTDLYVSRSIDPLRKVTDTVSARVGAALNGTSGADVVPFDCSQKQSLGLSKG